MVTIVTFSLLQPKPSLKTKNGQLQSTLIKHMDIEKTANLETT
jgi:hypothetical protein